MPDELLKMSPEMRPKLSEKSSGKQTVVMLYFFLEIKQAAVIIPVEMGLKSAYSGS